MLVFVDYEHASRHEIPELDWLMAARTKITYRLEDISGLPCHLVRYDRLTSGLLDQLDARAVFISGQSADPALYEAQDVAALATVVTEARLPVFGFCGGWQFIATALGSDLVPIEVPEQHRKAEIITEWPGGWPAEFGYHPVELSGGPIHPLLEGLGADPVFRHAHALHIADPPDGFRSLASTAVTPVQLAVDDSRHMVGTQFHPEYWTDDHPAGRTLIQNFLQWADVL